MKVVERYEDMSPRGRLRVFKQDDGDMIVRIIPDPKDENTKYLGDSAEFCTIGGGGGQSPNTLQALRGLMEAIEKDNAEYPQERGR